MSFLILAIDEEPTITDLICRFLELEHDHFTVLTAHSAQTALEVLSRRHVDAIITGLWRPELLSAARQRTPEIPVCYMPAAYDNEEMGALPPVLLLRKPFVRQDLTAAIHKMLGTEARTRAQACDCPDDSAEACGLN